MSTKAHDERSQGTTGPESEPFLKDEERVQELDDLSSNDEDLRKRHKRPRSSSSAILLLLGSACLFFLGYFSRMAYDHVINRMPSNVRDDRHSLAEELHGLVPEFPRQPKVFWNNSVYTPDAELSYGDAISQINTAWGQLIPDGHGFVEIEPKPEYELPLPWKQHGERTTELYGISVFHQVHCLTWILRSYVAYQYGEPQPKAINQAHVMHCFDFIRSSLMCCGDTALDGSAAEGEAELEDPKGAGRAGMGTTHICKDYDAIFAYALEQNKMKGVDGELPERHHH